MKASSPVVYRYTASTALQDRRSHITAALAMIIGEVSWSWRVLM